MESDCSGTAVTEGCKTIKNITGRSNNQEQQLAAKHVKDRTNAEDFEASEKTTNVSTSLTMNSNMDSDETAFPHQQTPSSSREMLNQQAQILIDEVNAKRKRDTAVLDEFKKSLEVQASNAYSMVEGNVIQLYEENGKILQEKLQDLFATLDRIAKLEQELEQFKVALGALYQDLH